MKGSSISSNIITTIFILIFPQSTVSESTLVALLAARKDMILQLRAELEQDIDDSVLNSRLVAYASDQVCFILSMLDVPLNSLFLLILYLCLYCVWFVQAHSSVEKAGLISLVKIRFLPSDEQLSLRGDTLKQAIQEDRRMGLVPFMVRTSQDPAICLVQSKRGKKSIK